MSALDTVADKLRSKSEELAGQGGIKDKVAAELADDAAFLRKLKPELIKRRARGRATTSAEPPPAPKRRTPERSKPAGDGPNPFVVIGAALVLGVALAKWLDWRGHAHPRW